MVVAASGFRAESGGITPVAPTICTLDTAISDYTLERIQDHLDPTDTTTEEANYRAKNGLNGLTFAGISIVTDSATCAAGIQAFAQIYHPTDTIMRNKLRAALDRIFIVQLSPNRFVMNANVYSPYILFSHFLVDSTFSVVSTSF